MTAGTPCAVRIALGMGAVAASLLMTATPASAHARVLRTTPGNGVTSDGRLAVISVVFDDPVQLVPRSLVLTGATGAPQTIGAPRVLDGRILEARLSDRLPAGRYFVGWRILSDDGHIESGNFGFNVAVAGAAPPATTGTGDVPPAPTEPIWPVIVAASMAAVACLGAALVVVRGLTAVRTAVGEKPYPDSPAVSKASTRGHTPSQR